VTDDVTRRYDVIVVSDKAESILPYVAFQLVIRRISPNLVMFAVSRFLLSGH